MTSANPSISPGSPLFFSRTDTSSATYRLVRSGRARQVGPRLYTTDMETDESQLILRDLWAVVAGYAPGAVISDRSGFELGAVNSSVIVVVERNANDVQLPGLRIRKRLGPGPLQGDQPFMGELFLASRPRLFLENLKPARARSGYRRTLTREHLEEELVKILQRQEGAGLNSLRDEARTIAPLLKAETEYSVLDDIIAALLTTGPDVTRTSAGKAYARSQAYDPDRMELFDTVLALEESRATVASDAETFIALLRNEHGRMLASRPEVNPGEFRKLPNQAGNTSFVAPQLVEGTLRQGYDRIKVAPPGFPRAIVTMFVVSEVHPFADGNGRVARLRMNAELTAAGQQRIIVPTGFQQDYLGALRRMSRAKNPDILLRAMDRAQEYCAEVPFPKDRRVTQRVLEATSAFDPEHVLRLPHELAAVQRAPVSLSSAARMAQTSLRLKPDLDTPEAIASGPFSVDQLGADDIARGLRELAAAGLAETDAGGRWRLTAA